MNIAEFEASLRGKGAWRKDALFSVMLAMEKNSPVSFIKKYGKEREHLYESRPEMADHNRIELYEELCGLGLKILTDNPDKGYGRVFTFNLYADVKRLRSEGHRVTVRIDAMFRNAMELLGDMDLKEISFK